MNQLESAIADATLAGEQVAVLLKAVAVLQLRAEGRLRLYIEATVPAADDDADLGILAADFLQLQATAIELGDTAMAIIEAARDRLKLSIDAVPSSAADQGKTAQLQRVALKTLAFFNQTASAIRNVALQVARNTAALQHAASVRPSKPQAAEVLDSLLQRMRQERPAKSGLASEKRNP